MLQNQIRIMNRIFSYRNRKGVGGIFLEVNFSLNQELQIGFPL